MTGLVVIAVVAAGYTVTLRLAATAMWMAERRARPDSYSDSSYENRDAPHFDDWMIAATIALAWPVSLPILIGMRVHGAFNGDAEQRWKTGRAQAVADRKERDRLAAIVEELNRPGGTP